MPVAIPPPHPTPPKKKQQKKNKNNTHSGDSVNPYMTSKIKHENGLDLFTWFVPNYLSVSY